MDTKQSYQKPEMEIIELDMECMIAASNNKLNYTTGGRGSEEDVNNYWNTGNPFAE